jgi:hypothetical protein
MNPMLINQSVQYCASQGLAADGLKLEEVGAAS